MAKWFGAHYNQEFRFSSAVKCKKGPQVLTSLLNQRRNYYHIDRTYLLSLIGQVLYTGYLPITILSLDLLNLMRLDGPQWKAIFPFSCFSKKKYLPSEIFVISKQGKEMCVKCPVRFQVFGFGVFLSNS